MYNSSRNSSVVLYKYIDHVFQFAQDTPMSSMLVINVYFHHQICPGLADK